MPDNEIIKIHSLKTDSTYFHNTNADLVALIPSNPGRILDIGCASGKLGEDIIKATAPKEYIGIEIVPEIAETARTRLSKVLIGNAESILPTIESESFDWIIMADILEHTVDPWSAISEVSRILKPQGMLLISIPNVRNLGVLFELVCKGRWDYTPFGIMDQGHLRFFTRSTITESLTNSGFKIQSCQSNSRNRWKRWRGKTIARILSLIIAKPSAYEEFITVQWIILAHKVSSPV
jgi:2-polyprenyl-3-methyl-5-hydroxy-6-metoxy-1,4-benzoquinol methylase